MKKIYSMLLVCAAVLPSAAQHTEWSVQIPSGIFSFGGAGSASSSAYLISDVGSIPNYTNNPYGTGSAYSYGLVVNVQRITKSNLIFGLQAGYESLSSKLKVASILGGLVSLTVKDGKSILTNQFINIHPFVGKRVKIVNHIDTDVTVGFDFALGLNSTEHATISTDQGITFSTSGKRTAPNLDFRPRVEILNYYKKIGFCLGYSYGLTDYMGGIVGLDGNVFSRLIRIGIAYRF
jgi:hypothetical protein